MVRGFPHAGGISSGATIPAQQVRRLAAVLRSLPDVADRRLIAEALGLIPYEGHDTNWGEPEPRRRVPNIEEGGPCEH